MWAPFTAIKYKALELLISAREVGLPISLRITDSVNAEDILQLYLCINVLTPESEVYTLCSYSNRLSTVKRVTLYKRK